MKNKKIKKYSRIILLITFILVYTSTVFVLSATSTENYNSLLVINRSSNNSIAPMFKYNEENKDNMFYPGYSTESILRVKNELGENVSINKLGMELILNSRYANEGLLSENNERYKAFMQDMKISIRYKNFITNMIEGILYTGSFEDFVNNSAKTNLNIKKGDSIDLVYTIEMMEKNISKNISSGIKADIVFNFNIEGKDIPDNDNGNPNDIIDIKETHWAHDCVISLLRAQIITGYSDGSIRPDEYITREEVATIITKAMLYDNVSLEVLPDDYKSIYTDRISNWALEYVNLATYNNIYSGYPNNTFRGNKNITREEAAKVIAIAFNKSLSADFDLTFDDKKAISNWSTPYIKALVKDNVLKGYPDNTFKPNKEITRAEFFSIICNELELHEQKKVNQ